MSSPRSERPHRSEYVSARPTRPGWIEIVVGLLTMLVAMVAVLIFGPLGLDLEPVTYGLVLAAWSGVAGLAGFGAAVLVRIRSLAPFGVRRTTWRWMAIGLAAGVLGLSLKYVWNFFIIFFTDFADTDPQGMYYDAAGGGVLPMLLTVLFLAVLTPIGEEFLFRGVLMNALLRYGPVIAVLSSSVVFALFHGFNFIFPAAVIVGIVAAEVARRSGSIWPAVVVHAVNNAAVPAVALIMG
ncbi:CPBP family intramembrane glutamic endopeptidase [Nocardiopsis sp. MG754419]|uniref:CPBP family intramembrane glutamic endopeptidase n=1 Tax=Nocardiopsis sp. MG754419 TaxID=2259865 RepID=UPI001BAB9BC5|nr:type II CAAX endopeptidase family protein [Nocardiopsis sp. MG754419]MBR8741007.1 CPBP family intramembrane metalloprotease [Nocardiopsis sp. MG754419]